MHMQQTKISGLLLVATAIAALALPALAGATTTLSRGAGVGKSPLSREARVGTSRSSRLATRLANGSWQ